MTEIHAAQTSTIMQDKTAWEITPGAPVIIPIGAIEQHGSHMPIDTDSHIATAISSAVAERIGAVVGPRFNYGCASLPVSGGGELFPGTISMQGETFTRVIEDLVVAFANHGHKRVAIINGHLENTPFAIEGAKRALRSVSADVVVLEWWTILPTEALDEIFDGEFPGWEAEHAGVIETSLLMHVAPERVINEKIENRMGSVPPPVYTVLPEREGLVDPSGILRTAWGANAELGRRIFSEIVDQCVAALDKEFGPL